jgi:hypothetical protein
MTTLNIELGKMRFNFSGEWVVGTVYEANDVVRYGGNLYAYINAASSAGMVPGTALYWKLMVPGINFLGPYVSTRVHNPGDAVSDGGRTYVCNTANTTVAPQDSALWTLFVDGMQFEGAYDATKTYQKNDIVSLGGISYIAKRTTIGNYPALGLNWAAFVTGSTQRGVYVSTATYYPSDVVTVGANTYICQIETSGTSPDSVTADWLPYTTGFRFRGAWISATQYTPGDVVTFGITVYICTARFNGVTPPDAIDSSFKVLMPGSNLDAALLKAGGTMTGPITFSADQFGTNIGAFLLNATSANLAAALTDETGTGLNVFNNTPTLITPILGTPTSGNLTNCTNAVGYALKSATTTIAVSAATAPTVGQLLTATSGTAAIWQDAPVSLPSQTGNAGKVLKTDGTVATWEAGSINGTSQRQVYVATAAQTTFAAVYDVGFVDVYLNGAKLIVNTDFTATSGTNIVLAIGATAGDSVDIVAYGTFNVANTYTVAQIDSLVVGLIDDRGSYNASVNTFPTTGGSGNAGAILKGDLWYVSVAGTLGSVAVAIGDSFRALTDTPGQTAANWSILESNIGYVPLSIAGGTMTGNLTLDAYTEKVATLATSGTIALNPATGTTLSCAATAAITFTDSLSSGQSISLLLTGGSSYTMTWPATTWVTAAGNTAPTLSANNTLVFWKIGTTLYGALVGKSA